MIIFIRFISFYNFYITDKYVTIAMANLFVRDVLEVKLSGKTKQIDKKRMLRFRQPKVFG